MNFPGISVCVRRRSPCSHRRRRPVLLGLPGSDVPSSLRAAHLSRTGRRRVVGRACTAAGASVVDGRPWVGVCMVASLDGSTVVEGRSGGLSNPNDAAVFGRLRRAADVVLVGASTVPLEGYGPPRKPGQRIGVVTASGNVDLDSELFTSGAGFLIMPEDGPAPGGAGRRGAGRDEVASTWPPRCAASMTSSTAPTFVQAEGGPHLNGALLDADCVDELDLTISPVLGGGTGPRLTASATPTLTRFTLAHSSSTTPRSPSPAGSATVSEARRVSGRRRSRSSDAPRPMTSQTLAPVDGARRVRLSCPSTGARSRGGSRRRRRSSCTRWRSGGRRPRRSCASGRARPRRSGRW